LNWNFILFYLKGEGKTLSEQAIELLKVAVFIDVTDYFKKLNYESYCSSIEDECEWVEVEIG